MAGDKTQERNLLTKSLLVKGCLSSFIELSTELPFTYKGIYVWGQVQQFWGIIHKGNSSASFVGKVI